MVLRKANGLIKKNKDELGNFLGTPKRLICHILPPLKPYNFSLDA